MELTVTVNYPAPVQEVARMLADPAFTREARFGIAGLSDEDRAAFEVSTEGTPEGAFAVTIEGPVPPSVIPQNMRNYVPSAVRVHGVDRWDAPTDDGARTGELEASVRGVPATVTARQELRAAESGTGSVRTVHATISVKIPLVGNKIERMAAGYVTQMLEGEETAAAQWLSSH